MGVKVIVCCLCSREKAQDEHPIPARQRYKGSHIPIVEHIAKRNGRELFFLSGFYGLTPADCPIRNYDFLLTKEAAKELVSTVREQLLDTRVNFIIFYTKKKPAWDVYTELLEKAVEGTGIELHIHPLCSEA